MTMKRADELLPLSASVSTSPPASPATSVRPSLSKRAQARRLRREELREQSPSPFKDILERLMHAVPGALGAIVVDREGEAVDYAGSLSSFHTKLMGAHLRVALDAGLAGALAETHPRQLTVRAAGASFLIRSLPDGYALALVLTRGAFEVSPRALANAERELAVEAGWKHGLSPSRWYPAEVQASPSNRFRPGRLRWGSRWEDLIVLGTVIGLRREHGYRCRLGSGPEVTLVREPAGHWYADESTEHGESLSPLDSRRAKS
jgi:predicted regulator of Ras-like GTPase activity (Roadblock/LC7/MglB family)